MLAFVKTVAVTASVIITGDWLMREVCDFNIFGDEDEEYYVFVNTARAARRVARKRKTKTKAKRK